MSNVPMPELSSGDAALLLKALDAMADNLQKLRRVTRDPMAQNSADAILSCILSSRTKLRKGQLEFDQNEIASLYLALSELRDGLSDILDGLPAASELRPGAQASFRQANHLLRRLKKFFEEQDVDTAALLRTLRSAM